MNDREKQIEAVKELREKYMDEVCDLCQEWLDELERRMSGDERASEPLSEEYARVYFAQDIIGTFDDYEDEDK